MDEPRVIPTVPYEDAPAWAPGAEDHSRTKEQRDQDAKQKLDLERQLDDEQSDD